MVTTKKATVDAAEKKAAEKAVAPAADTKVSEKKAEVKAEPKKEEVKKAEKPAASKAKKAPAKKETAIKSTLYVQYDGKEHTEKDLVAMVKKAYVKLGNKAADIKTIDIYLKPDESVAYYVINGVGSDDFKIEL